MVFIENSTFWKILLWEHNDTESFLSLQFEWKHNFWVVKGFIYEMHFSELNIILQCAVSSAIQVQNKVFYRKISKGTRYNTSDLFWNTVAFQYFLTTEVKK